MAFAGVTFTCASSGQPVRDGDGVQRQDTQPILSAPLWSETLSLGGVTTQFAPSTGSVYHVKAHADCYVAFGPSPDASKTVSTDRNSARIPLASGETIDLYVRAGDKGACATA